jgi:hypothetical protein
MNILGRLETSVSTHAGTLDVGRSSVCWFVPHFVLSHLTLRKHQDVAHCNPLLPSSGCASTILQFPLICCSNSVIQLIL